MAYPLSEESGSHAANDRVLGRVVRRYSDSARAIKEIQLRRAARQSLRTRKRCRRIVPLE
jgi:hypothetical protein